MAVTQTLTFTTLSSLTLLLLLLLFLTTATPSLSARLPHHLTSPLPPSSSVPHSLRRRFPPGNSAAQQNIPLKQLEYDYYRDTCPKAEEIIYNVTSDVVRVNKTVPPQLLRLMFHDCFIKGCDASVLLDDSNGNKTHEIEKNAPPNQTLKGFEVIDKVKDALEAECPNVVSCADIVVLATRNAVVLSGGPFFPVLTGRKDSLRSYSEDARNEIPRPHGSLQQTLNLFEQRGFKPAETVTLLGAHSIGKIGCQFILPRLSNFNGTDKRDPTVRENVMPVLKRTCPSNATSAFSGSAFDNHYFENLVKERGLLQSDQMLMTDPVTARVVRAFSASNSSSFPQDFAKAMLKMSNLASPSGSQGEVRKKCSLPNRN